MNKGKSVLAAVAVLLHFSVLAQVQVATKSISEPRSVSLSGNRAYILSINGSNFNSWLSVLDISNPATPSTVSTYSPSSPYEYFSAIHASGNSVFIAGFVNLNVGSGFVRVLDFTAPSAPAVVGGGNAGSFPRSVYGQMSSFCVTSNGAAPFFSRLTSSGQLGSGIVESESLGAVFMAGTYAYVAAGSSVKVFDISNTASPQQISMVSSGPNGAALSALEVVVSGALAYVWGNNGLMIYDVANPHSPQFRGSFSVSTPAGTPTSFDVSGGFAFIASNSSLQIVDVSNPTSPVLKATFSDPLNSLFDNPSSTKVSGDYIYVVDRNRERIVIIKFRPITIQSFSPGAGPVGTKVTILGSNFNPVAGENTIKFGSTSGSISTASASSLLATVPVGASTGPITVGDVNQNQLAASSSSFIVTNPTINSPGSIVFGTSISLSVDTGGSTGAVTYSLANGTGSATLNGNLLTATGAGIVTVTANISASGPYPAITLSKAISIQKAPQSIPSWVSSASCDLFPYALSATSSAGLPVQYTSSNTSVATISGNVVSFIGPGTTTIYASQAGNSNYYSTGYSQTLQIEKANQAVTISGQYDQIVKRYGDTPFNISASATSGLPVTWSNPYDIASISSNGAVTILNAGETQIMAQQAGNACFNPAWAQKSLIVQKAAQQMSFNAPTGNYCGESPLVTVSSNSNNPVLVNVLSPSGVDPFYVSLGNNVFKFIQSGVFSFSQSSSRNFEAASSSWFQVMVDPYPAGFLSTSDPIVFCTPGNFGTQLNLTLQSQGVHYVNWVKDGYDIPFAYGTNYNANQPGVYTARIARNTPSGCTIVTDPITVSVLNCNDFVVSPNPANEIVTLTLPGALGYGTQARIVDPYQGVVANTWIQSNQTTATLNIENLPAGIYQVQIDVSGNTLSRNLSIIH